MKLTKPKNPSAEIRLAKLQQEYDQAVRERNNLRNEIEIEAESLRIMRTNLRLENEYLAAIRKQLAAFKKSMRAH